jgi:hypothetical protein
MNAACLASLYASIARLAHSIRRDNLASGGMPRAFLSGVPGRRSFPHNRVIERQLFSVYTGEPAFGRARPLKRPSSRTQGGFVCEPA